MKFCIQWRRRAVKLIAEVKSASQVNNDKNTRLFQDVAPIIQKQGWEFLVITDEMIRQGSLLSNIKLLYRYALIPLTLQTWINCHQYFINQPPITLKTAEQDLKSQGIFREVLFKLRFLGILDTNLKLPLGSHSLISLSAPETEIG